MKVAIIGGGFAGLTAAYELGKRGHEVTVFEKDKVLGGLAHGFKPTYAKASTSAKATADRSAGKQKDWDWHLEGAYHHLFTNDYAIINLIKELGLEKKLIIKRPITATLMPSSVIPVYPSSWSHPGSAFAEALADRSDSGQARMTRFPNAIYQLDSPIHLLRFPYLSPVDKVRTAALLAFLKFNPFWQPLEHLTAEKFFKTIGGSASWRILWEPLMRGKFGEYAPTIAASWLWARVKKRTPSLCYIEGGFQTLVNALQKTIEKQGGEIYKKISVTNIQKSEKYFILRSASWRREVYQNSSRPAWRDSNNMQIQFDAVLLTVPTPVAAKLIQFPTSFIQPLLNIPHLHAQTLILETKEPILKACPEQSRGVYWLNINDRSFPFLAVVAHTNFMDKKHYAGHHLTYFGNYLPQGHPYLSMTKKQLLKKFLPFIKRLNPTLSLVNSFMFVGPFAQPVHQLHYSRTAPTIKTPISNVYLANLDSIYPWDRGTNYAVELGQKAAREIIRSSPRTKQKTYSP